MKKTTRNILIIGAAIAIGVGVLVSPISETVQRIAVQSITVPAGSSVQTAINTAGVGDTVIVQDDHSTEAITINKGITLTSNNGVVKGVTVSADNVTISELTISKSAGFGVYSTAKNTVVKNNIIIDAQRDGILFSKSTTNGTIIDNIIQRASQSCIEVRGTGNTVDGNDCSGTIQYPNSWTNPPNYLDADCFRFFGSGHIFKNNYCHDITYGAQPGGNNIDPHVDGFQTWGDTGRGIAHDILFDGNVIILSGSGGGVTNKSIQLEGGG